MRKDKKMSKNISQLADCLAIALDTFPEDDVILTRDEAKIALLALRAVEAVRAFAVNTSLVTPADPEYVHGYNNGHRDAVEGIRTAMISTVVLTA
jgi:hypothetical protein